MGNNFEKSAPRNEKKFVTLRAGVMNICGIIIVTIC